MWDVEQGTAGETLSGHASGISSLQMTRDGRTLYTRQLTTARCSSGISAAHRRLGRPFTAGAAGSPWIVRARTAG